MVQTWAWSWDDGPVSGEGGTWSGCTWVQRSPWEHRQSNVQWGCEGVGVDQSDGDDNDEEDDCTDGDDDAGDEEHVLIWETAGSHYANV